MGEVCNGRGDGAGEVVVLEDGEAGDAAGGVAVDAVPVTTGGGGLSGGKVVGVVEGGLDGEEGLLVVLVALGSGDGKGGWTTRGREWTDA